MIVRKKTSGGDKLINTILFDLDGTLSDPKIGITKSVQYALAKIGIDEPDLDKLDCFIGPPLQDSFAEYYSFDEGKTNKAIDTNKTLIQIASTCFAVTWLNPQALIDGSLLLGGFRAALSTEASNLFIIGVCGASFLWFGGLTTVVSVFKNNFNYKVIRWINIICGGIIIYFGLKLGYSFIKIMV